MRIDQPTDVGIKHSSDLVSTGSARDHVIQRNPPTAPATDALGSYAAALGSRPRATEAQVRQIGLQLAAIQPEMGSIKVSRIESWSDSTCGDIWAADPTIDLVERTKSRFAGGDRPPLSDAQAQQVVAAITETYCHA